MRYISGVLLSLSDDGKVTPAKFQTIGVFERSYLNDATRVDSTTSSGSDAKYAGKAAAKSSSRAIIPLLVKLRVTVFDVGKGPKWVRTSTEWACSHLVRIIYLLKTSKSSGTAGTTRLTVVCVAVQLSTLLSRDATELVPAPSSQMVDGALELP